jgi:hypothetical protein
MPRKYGAFQSTAPTDLECGHTSIWAGRVGEHVLPMECTICTSEDDARSELSCFAGFVESGRGLNFGRAFADRITTRQVASLAAVLALSIAPAFARGSGHGHGYSAARAKCYSCPRDSRGRIVRSAESKREFRRAHPCPSTGRSSGACPGYVIDHVKPLKRGGADAPSNMQWQTMSEAKAKDRVE